MNYIKLDYGRIIKRKVGVEAVKILH